MLQQIATRQVETGGISQSNAFTIKANGKAFKVLIDGLYSDKIKSIIRELWTNAYDAHLMAGTEDRPFRCMLPNRLEPEFSVRDYGISMTHEQVMKLYTTVFESTKDQSNDQVGQLGLGSKSPFAYTDTFSVTAYLDGVQRMYSAYIGEDGVPMIALLGETETDEPNGLEVGFPVKLEDVDAFMRAARSVIQGFDVKPKIVGQKLDELVQERVYEGTGWYTFKGETYGRNTAYARQGCVLYPLDSAVLDDKGSGLLELLRANIVIDFPIGSLDISASRESLGYDDRTKANIMARLNDVAAEMDKQFDDMIAATKTLWDLKALDRKIHRNDAGLPHVVVSRIRDKIIYKGRKVHQISPQVCGDSRGYDRFLRSRFHFSRRTHQEIHRMKGMTFKTSDGRYTLCSKDEAFLIFLTDPNVKVVNESIRIRRVYDAYSMGKTDMDEYKLITATNFEKNYSGNPVQTGAVYTFSIAQNDKRTLAKLMAILGNPRPDQVNIIWTHDIPEPPKEAKASYGRRKVELKRVTTRHSLQDIDIQPEDIKLYVDLNRDTFMDGDRSVSMYNVASMYNFALDEGWIEQADLLVAVPASRSNVLKHAPDAVNLFDLFRENLKDAREVELEDYYDALEDGLNHTHAVFESLTSMLKIDPDADTDGKRSFPITDLMEGSTIRELLEMRQEMYDALNSPEGDAERKRVQKIGEYSKMLFGWNYCIRERNPITDDPRYVRPFGQETFKEIAKKYPYLEAIVRGVNYDDKKVVVDYINDVDTQP